MNRLRDNSYGHFQTRSTWLPKSHSPACGNENKTSLTNVRSLGSQLLGSREKVTLSEKLDFQEQYLSLAKKVCVDLVKDLPMGSIHEERDKKNRIREMFYSNRVRQLVEEKRTLSHEKFPEQDAMKRDNLADYRYSIEKVKGKPEQWSNRETEQSNRETEKSNRETQRAIRTKQLPWQRISRHCSTSGERKRVRMFCGKPLRRAYVSAVKPLKINLEEATGLTEITETLESGQQKQLFRNGSARPSNSKIGEYASSRRCTTKPDELFTHIIDEPVKISERSGWQVNSHFCKLDEFAFHIQVLLRLCKACQLSSDLEATLSKLLHDYVLKTRVQLGANTCIDDISRLDQALLAKKQQSSLRHLVFLQRVCIVTTIDALTQGNIQRYLHDIIQILTALIGIYIHLLDELILKKQSEQHQLSENCLAAQTLIHKQANSCSIHIRRQLLGCCELVNRKLYPLMKANTVLFTHIKSLMPVLKTTSPTINKAFYELLKLYAVYLNANETNLDQSYGLLRAFATSPSPYILLAEAKVYTAVIDLDGTLLISSRREGQKLKFRAYLKDFLERIRTDYEIIVFTSRMPLSADPIVAQIGGVAYTLYRYHTTRARNRCLRDLSRIGRNLARTVYISTNQDNSCLQPQNSIRINRWQEDDRQLLVLAQYLIDLALEKCSDCRTELHKYQAYRRSI